MPVCRRKASKDVGCVFRFFGKIESCPPILEACGNIKNILVVDFDSDTPSFWKVFLTWLDVVKGLFFTM